MRRRTFLSSMGVMIISGCSSQSNDSPEDTANTQTATTSPTSTSTQESPPPKIEEFDLLSHWDKYGDVLEHGMDSVGAGAYANIGLRYELPVYDGKSEELVQATVYRDGSSVDSRKAEETYLSGEGESRNYRERMFAFDTQNWDTGTYNAEAIVRDEISDKNSSNKQLSFEVIDPLRSNEVELTRVEIPPTVKKGEPLTFTLHLKNVSGSDNSIVSSISGRYEGNEWQTATEEKFKLNIPAGETRTWESAEFTFDYEGTYEQRLDSVEKTWAISVQE